jgi:hypothetical protein
MDSNNNNNTNLNNVHFTFYFQYARPLGEAASLTDWLTKIPRINAI